MKNAATSMCGEFWTLSSLHSYSLLSSHDSEGTICAQVYRKPKYTHILQMNANISEAPSPMEHKRQLPNCKVNKVLHPQSQLTRRFRKDHKNWLPKAIEEMKASTASSSKLKLFKLMCGEQRTSVNETICHKSGKLNHERKQTLDRWAEYLRRQSSWHRYRNRLCVNNSKSF